MNAQKPDYSWLPPRHHQVLFTLAQADDHIWRCLDALYDYVTGDTMELETVRREGRAHLTVKSVAPLPEAMARYAADALTQLRAALEHTLFAEVEHQLGRTLTDKEERSVEMPVYDEPEKFAKWLTDKRRATVTPLHEGTELGARIAELQPYEHSDHQQHPLRLLAEHTNLAKHRTPGVAATRLGVIIPDYAHPELEIHEQGEDQVLRTGTVLVSGPNDLNVGLSIWPQVSIMRPHTQGWYLLMRELQNIELWVRTVAVPHLILGRHDVDALPPHLDITRGYRDFQDALRHAESVPAAARADVRIREEAVARAMQELQQVLDRTDPSEGDQHGGQ